MRKALPALLALLLAALAPAQSTFTVQPSRETPHERSLQVTITPTLASARGGGYGWITVEVHNSDRARHEVEIDLHEMYANLAAFRVTRRIVLEGGGDFREHLPMPGVPRPLALRVVADGYTRGAQQQTFGTTENPEEGVSVLHVGGDASAATAWRTALENHVAPFPTQTVSHWENGKNVEKRLSALRMFAQRAPADLPESWWLLSGFDLVVVDGRAPLEQGAQRVLADYVRGGGNLLVTMGDGLGPGAPLLQALGATQGANSGTHGFGAWFVDEVADGLDSTTRQWLGTHDSGVLAAHKQAWSGPVPDGLGASLAIPGLGAVPVGLFFFIVLAFAIVAGPINHFYWWRKRRLAMLLVTVPAAGCTVTAVILVFGLFSEGLGVKGVIASVTLLDQRSHDAVSCSAAKIYAGLQPAPLRPAPSTYVFGRTPEARRAWDQPEGQVLALDRDRGEIDGALIGSRTVAPVVTVSMGPARERVRFRARPDGGYDALCGDALALASTSGASIVLCDLDGAWFAGATDGVLRKTYAPGVENLRWQFGSDAARVFDGFGHEPLALTPGSYLALVAADPALDDLGLSVAWLERAHLVRGVCAPEDFVR